MRTRKIFNLILSFMVAISMMLGSGGQALATPPNSAPAEANMTLPAPHYYGPSSNYANSAFTLGDANVTFNGDGTGAAATATVGADGVITGLTITSPGSGYTTATVSITSASGGAGAAADAIISPTNAVTAINVTANGSLYTTPVVAITGGGATTNATATAYGGLDSLTITNAGTGYTMPTVDFDMPDDPNGVQATGHVDFDATTGAITAIYIDNPGSGYASAPNVVIRDGTVYAPLNTRNQARANAAKAEGKLAPQAEAEAITSDLLNATATGVDATAVATINVQSVTLNTFGAGYTSIPAVGITDATGIGAGATADAVVNGGAITGLTLTSPGTGYLTQGGIKKFTDGLPMLCLPTANFSECAAVANNLGQYMPVGVADTTTFTTANGYGPDADYYVIALVQHSEQMSSSLPAKTMLREYVQLETPANAAWSKHVALMNDMLDGTQQPILWPATSPLGAAGTPVFAVDDPHYLGPIIVAAKDKPVRISFYNLLPTGEAGNLFLPVDTSFMGSGEGNMMDGYDPTPTTGGTAMDTVRNPMCELPGVKDPVCFTDNRATLHLHGGDTPWISDGTPHQWITPAGETTAWPQGVDVYDVPDMQNVPGVPNCAANNDGCMTFYYSNEESARLLFYHDHAWGITRLNVYAGEAAGYVITDTVEQKLFGTGGPYADMGEGIPLVVQDKTFVPGATQILQQDPTWDASRWGGEGSLWYEHVYMPAQNPGDPSGMSAYGRWMYGPWFWPPQNDLKYGPIANPYFDPNCNLNDPATWQYQEAPYCEPPEIPGTPNISSGMEQFNDTPVVNGTAYPTLTVDPKAYRFRILNAANDRFWNLQWYIADPSSTSAALNAAGQPIGATEVALKASEVAAAQTDINVFPTPDTTISPPGPNFIQIGTEAGFLAAPVIVPNQPITWITDPTRFDFGNVDLHALLVAPAERADVIVDFSQFAGQTLIMYNDAPAAFPARVAGYDYYTGHPDSMGNGSTLPGFGPNTRTVMQVKVSATAPAPAFNFNTLYTAFKHHADGSGVFESGQEPIIVGQAGYNSAYGTSFAAAGDCSSSVPPLKCDGFARIAEYGGTPFTFDTLKGIKITIPISSKALHDEMNSATFDEYGRMTANLGVEATPSNPGGQNIVLMPYVFPPTEIYDGTNLPQGDINITPISTATDGTQIWKISHNGVDTHPIHWHLYDVQVLNRVTWDNIIIPPDATELGFKDTVRVSPLEDTIVAVRPIIPSLPFELPNDTRLLDPTKPEWNGTYNPAGGNVATIGDVGVIASSTVQVALAVGIPPANPEAQPIDVLNHYINFGWEYVWHCHILGHEEMDMMRPVAVAIPPRAPDGLQALLDSLGGNTVQLIWNDNTIAETGYTIERSNDAGITWTQVATLDIPLNQPNTTGQLTYTDTVDIAQNYQYRVMALNTVGDTWNYADPGNQIPMPGTTMPLGFPTVTAKSAYSNVADAVIVPAAPTNLTATLQAGPQVSLAWTDNATDETGYTVEVSVNGGAFSTLVNNLPINSTSYVDTSVTLGNTYTYQVAAQGVNGLSAYSNTATVLVDVPAAPANLVGTLQAGPQVSLTWTENPTNVTGFVVEVSVNGGTFSTLATLAANTANYVDTSVLLGNTYTYQVAAQGILGLSAYSNTVTVLVDVPAAPTNLVGTLQAGPQVSLTWTDNATNETGYVVEVSVNGGAFSILATLLANTTSYMDTSITAGNTYTYRVAANGVLGLSAYSNAVTVATLLSPTNLVATNQAGPQVNLTWTDNATNETAYVVEVSVNGGAFSTLVNNLAANTTSYVDASVTLGNTYTYRVAASDGLLLSGYSNTASVLVDVPAAPTNLVATLQAGPQVSLTWTDNANNETGYVVEVSVNGGAFSTLVNNLAANTTSYLYSSVAVGNTYTYRVAASNVLGLSAYSNTATVIVALPARPTNLVGTLQAGPQIGLTWTDNATNETGYVVMRSVNGGPYVVLANLAANTASYTDTAITTNNSYSYRVAANNALGQSGFSNTVTVTVTALRAPTNLAATVQAGPQVRLTWRDNATNETGYVVEISVNGGAFSTLVNNLAANTTSYVDTSVTLGNTYAYRVAASGLVGLSTYSNTVTALVDVPAAPSSLSAIPVLSRGQERVTLSWVDNANNETGFTIQWSADPAFATIAGSLTARTNATTAVTGRIALQVWYFRIQANNILGSSAWVTTGGIQPAAAASPLIFLSTFTSGLADWSGQIGNVQAGPQAAMGGTDGAGLVASWNTSSTAGLVDQPAFVSHKISDALGSYMADFSFNPNGAITSGPMDIFTGLDAYGGEIFGVQFEHTANAPTIYRVRGWMLTVSGEEYTNWLNITNAEHEIQLDWQSDQESSLNLSVDDQFASVSGDTSMYKVTEERLGPSRGLMSGSGDDDALTAAATAGATQSIYLDEFISLSTEVTNPAVLPPSFHLFLPVIHN